MNWSTSVVTTASSDTEPSILVTFDNAKYLFNAGGGIGRAFLQSNQNWKRMRSVFLTQMGTHRSGGLPGLMMSFADTTIPKINLIGPPGLVHFVASSRMYTYRDSMPVATKEASPLPTSTLPDPVFQDENITVYSIPIHPDLPIPVPSPEPAAGHKRKRSSSFSSISRASRSDIPPPGSLDALMKQPYFDSRQLKGTLAQEWRRLMIDHTFPASNVRQPKRSEVKVRSQAPSTSEATPSMPKPDAPLVPQTETMSRNPFKPQTVLKTVTSLEPKEQSDHPHKLKAVRPSQYYYQLPQFNPPIPLYNPQPLAFAYVVVGPRIRGKFDIAKARELKVPFGPERGRLTRGELVTFTVKLEDGTEETRTVKPEDCIGDSETPGVVLILDVPSPEHITPLFFAFQNNPFYGQMRSQKEPDRKEYAVRAVYHLLGDGVLEDPRYSPFMNGFHSETHHIISSKSHCPDPVTFTSSAYNQLRLNQLDPEIFPVPYFSLTPPKDLSSVSNLPPSTHVMASGTKVSMRPPAPPVQAVTADDLFHPAASSLTPLVLAPQTLDHFNKSRRWINRHKKASWELRAKGGWNVGVLPLGTGSALPTKYRNVSSTLIQIPEWGNILLDAGEGTWGQLVRQFGPGKGPNWDGSSSSPSSSSSSANPPTPAAEGGVWKVLRDLKILFVSHVHADHHLGVAHILAQRKKLNPPPKDPLYLVTIRAVHLYLREMSDIQDLGLDVEEEVAIGNSQGRRTTDGGVITVMSEALHTRNQGVYPTQGLWKVGGNEWWTDPHRSVRHAKDMCRLLGLESFETVGVHHRTKCYGCVIKHGDQWSIVFSGDTQPTDALVRAGRGATLLIHEATMADDQEEMARLKAHSTFGQAVDVGRRMRAKNILLTHFSARYPKMPPPSALADDVVMTDDEPEGYQQNANQSDEGTDSLESASPDEGGGGVAGGSGQTDKIIAFMKASSTVNQLKRIPVIALAFDNASFKIGNMWKMKYMLPAVEQSFADTAEEEGEGEDVLEAERKKMTWVEDVVEVVND